MAETPYFIAINPSPSAVVFFHLRCFYQLWALGLYLAAVSKASGKLQFAA